MIEMMKKLILIDGNALIHRGFHAMPPLTTKKGEMVNAVFGFASMMINVMFKEKPDYMAVAFDSAKKTFRHEEYKEYKATRVKAPQELYDQIPRVKEVVEAFKIPIFEKEGFEADDLLGTLATKAKERPELVTVIVTGDMDILQLVNKQVLVAAPYKGFSETKHYGVAEVMEKLGVKPEQVVDYKALRGDASDNIPGVMGIGEKGAVNLLTRFESLKGIYENLEEVGGNLQKKLEAGREMAFLSQRLAQLVNDVEVEFKLEECSMHDYDKAAVKKLFEELNFKSLLKKLGLVEEEEARFSGGLKGESEHENDSARGNDLDGHRNRPRRTRRMVAEEQGTLF